MSIPLTTIRTLSAKFGNLSKEDQATVRSYVRKYTTDEMTEKINDINEKLDKDPNDEDALKQVKLYATAIQLKSTDFKLGGRKTRRRRATRRRRHH
jgi:hypothetical protein